MTNRLSIPLVVAIVSVLALGALGYVLFESSQPGNVTLRFSAVVDGEPLSFDQFLYRNPGGDGEFKVRDFQFFISNIKLIGDAGEYDEPDSYHLARFDSDLGTYDIVLHNVPREDYHTLQLSVGVDAARNGSIDVVGDLDPNGRMAWTWDVGYKFILFEGGLMREGTQYPLVYHVGFDENYKPMRFSLDETAVGSSTTLDFRVDVMKLFTGASTIDMAALPDVKFDSVDAARIAANYERMVSLCAAGSHDCTIVFAARLP